jgi:two-component system LytT family sensor kinase
VFSVKQIIKIWFQKYKLHLLIWAIYIFYETVVVGLAFGVFGHPVTYIAHYAAILLFFYLHGNYLLPLALNEKHNPFWCIPLIIIAEVVCFVYLSYLLDKALIFSTIISAKEPLSLNYQYWLKISYRGLYFLGFATGYYYLITALKERRRSNNLEQQRLIDIIERQKTEQELAKAQNAFLKAQINPHFLILFIII